jgi:dephospho-CoA kinase
MKIIGLTGGIGMGKSTAAAVFRRVGIPVFDADAAVHALQACGGRAVAAIEAAFPGTVLNGAVDRAALRHVVLGKPDALRKLESILHPMVRQQEAAFLRRARFAGKSLAVLDIPLLLETGGDRDADWVIVVSAPRTIQEQRVRRRRGLSTTQAGALIARQMPDSEKRRRADAVIQTGLSRHHSFRALSRLIRELRRDPHRTVRYGNHRFGAASRASRYRSGGSGIAQ